MTKEAYEIQRRNIYFGIKRYGDQQSFKITNIQFRFVSFKINIWVNFSVFIQ